MELKELQRNWGIFGREDPCWAILAWKDKKGNWDLEEFFASGAREITEVMRYLADLHLDGARHRALDFGCGLGRLTQALASHFAKATGIDIAPSMIAQAQALDLQHRCEFILNDRADLSMFPDNSFDFIYSNIVLQHMRPEYSTAYVREFGRVLVSGGVGVFQLPSRYKPPVGQKSWKDLVRPFIPSPVLDWYKDRRRSLAAVDAAPPQPPRARMEIYTVPKAQVLELIETSGCRLMDAIEDTAAGEGYESWRYCTMKR